MSSHRLGNVRQHMLLTAFSYFFVPLVGLLTAPILAQALGVTGRGSVAAAVAPLNLAIGLFSFGFPQSMVHHVAKHPSALGSIFKPAIVTQLILGILGTLILVILAPLLSGNSHDLQTLIIFASVLLPLTLIAGLSRGIASGLHAWGLVTFERCVTEAIKLIALLTLMVMGVLTVFSAVLVMAASPIVGSLAYLLTLRRIPQDVAKPEVRRISFREVISFGARIWVGSLSGILLTRVSQVVMTPLSSVSQLGYFVAAVNVSDVALLANNAVRDVTLASDSAKSNTARATASARCSFLISLAIGAFIILTLPLWFTRLFGDSFKPSELFVAVLVLANVIGVPGSVAGAILSSRGFPGRRSLSLLIACLINLILLFLLLPQLGALGACIASLVGNMVASNLNILFAKRLFSIPVKDFYLIRLADVILIVQFALSTLKIRKK